MTNMTRRSFVAGTVGASVAATGLATSRPSPRVLGANERLRVGVVGFGAMGSAHVKALLKMKETDNVEVVAVCEAYKPRLEAAVDLSSAKPFNDYRRLLDQKDVDYVVLAVPEHWHCKMTLDAAEAGKHIYCEKPMTHTVEEGKKVVKKIKQTGVKMQVGVQGMSDDSYETARGYIREGALGKVVMAQIDYSRNYLGDFWVEPDEDVRPGENLDWKAFLGPAKKRPFERDRFLAWRRYWDYSGGIATDLLVHRVTRLVKAIDLKHPSRVVATGGKFFFTDSPAEIPDTFNVMVDYPEGLTLILVSSLANRAAIRHMIRGHEATLDFNDDGFVIEPEKEFAEEKKRIVHTKSGKEDISLHHRNLQAAIRTNEPLKCDVDLGFYGALPCQMAVEAYRRNEYLTWDARRQKVVKA